MDIIYRYDPYEPIARRAYDDPEAALQALAEGNERFARINEQVRDEVLGHGAGRPVIIPCDPLTLGLPLGSGGPVAQAPFALVLGCSDARAPIERIFDRSTNELFVIRIAGNVLGVECLGSIHYAVRNLGESLKVLVVLGHSGCGAVTAAVDSYLNPMAYGDIALTHALRSLIDRIQIAVRGAANALKQVAGNAVTGAPGFRAALIETAVYLNAAIGAFDLRREQGVAADAAERVAYGVFDLVSQRVQALPGASAQGRAFGDAPEHAEDLVAHAVRIAEAVVAQGHLG